MAFDASSSFDPEGGPLTYTWRFGDGGMPSTEATAVHTYLLPGTYSASITVVDDFGQPDTDIISITVTFPSNNPPVASPTATPTSGSAPLAVQFAANASDPDGDALAYSWDFGDPASGDNSSTLVDPAHTYAWPGSYTVWLTVSDGTDDVSESLTVVVDSPIDMSVRWARVKWTKNRSTIGNIHLEADVDVFQPAGSDLIVMSFDGITLFAAPFSDFTLTDDDGSTIYQLKGKNLLVKLDIENGWVKVLAHKKELSSINNANGVDVELHVAEAAAVENIAMAEAPGRKLIYRRQE